MNDDHMLSQPLLTEDGFLNEACLNELSKAISNMQRTHERLADDLEWSAKRWTFVSDVTGAFAKWSVRQAPVGIPDRLGDVLGFLNASLLQSGLWNSDKMAELSLCDINKLLFEILYDSKLEAFIAWNETKPDFIDLDALLHNVCLDIRMERRAFDLFNKEFEEKHSFLEKNVD